MGPAAWRRQREGLRVRAAAEEERARWQRAAEEQQVHDSCERQALVLVSKFSAEASSPTIT